MDAGGVLDTLGAPTNGTGGHLSGGWGGRCDEKTKRRGLVTDPGFFRRKNGRKTGFAKSGAGRIRTGQSVRETGPFSPGPLEGGASMGTGAWQRIRENSKGAKGPIPIAWPDNPSPRDSQSAGRRGAKHWRLFRAREFLGGSSKKNARGPWVFRGYFPEIAGRKSAWGARGPILGAGTTERGGNPVLPPAPGGLCNPAQLDGLFGAGRRGRSSKILAISEGTIAGTFIDPRRLRVVSNPAISGTERVRMSGNPAGTCSGSSFPPRRPAKVAPIFRGRGGGAFGGHGGTRPPGNSVITRPVIERGTFTSKNI